MKVLSFLGTGNYQPVIYVWEDETGRRCHPTEFFPEALAHIFNPQKVLMFLTNEAKQKYFDKLAQRLGDLLEVVDIPDGKSEQELWEIFQRVTASVEKDDAILLDITHAFRSIPMIVFAAAAYLRRTKNVKIEHIVYGAYEARVKSEAKDTDDEAPIFDLTPLLDLLDWLSGAEFFIRRSDATILAERLRAVHQRAWRNRTSGNLPTHLKSIAQHLEKLSHALYLARPRDVMRSAHELLPHLQDATAEAQNWAKPFATILEQIRSETAKLAHDSPNRLDRINLQKQLVLIEYFIEKGLVAQAILLAREWIIDWVALQKGDGDWLDKEYRENLAKALGAACNRLQGGSAEVPQWFDQLPNSSRLVQIWDSIVQLRNDLAHCGMRKSVANVASIETEAKGILKALKELMEGAPEATLHGGRVVIDLSLLYDETARLDELPEYIRRVVELAGDGNEVVLTGQAPVWLYLAAAHTIHGKARRLLYRSPTTGEITIFDHTAL